MGCWNCLIFGFEVRLLQYVFERLGYSVYGFAYYVLLI